MAEATRDDWRHLGQAFQNMGANIWLECENASEQPELNKLYSHYAQLLHTIKANLTFIYDKVEHMLDGE